MYMALNMYRVDPSRGGAETYVADLCRSLVREGHAVDLIANDWDSSALPEEVGRVRIEARGLTRSSRLWDFARRSESFLRQADYDCSIGFINTWYHDIIIPQGGIQAASLACNSRRYAAGWRRGAYLALKRIQPKYWVYRAIEREQYDPARGARVVAVSGLVRDHLERYRGVPRSRISVIPNAVDVERLRVEDRRAVRTELRNRYGVGADEVVALFVGHNARLKGLGPLLEALALRKRRDRSARPIRLLARAGGKTAAFQRTAKALGIAADVRFVGFLKEVSHLYHASDFFVLPTYYDPCSLVVFEALACGLPVITTAQNGASELLTEREGFVIPSPDAVSLLADDLDRIADDRIRESMSVSASLLGKAQSHELHLRRLLALCEKVAEEKKGGRSPSEKSVVVTA